MSLHPNIGVVLLGVVQFILGFVFISTAFIHHKFAPQHEVVGRVKKSLLLIAALILVCVYFVVDYYLDLPETELPTKTLLKTIASVMGVIAIIYSAAIENTAADYKLKRTTLFTYLSGKKISYLHVCLVMVGALFIFLGWDSLFI